jgi:hypothetical protein
MFVGMQISIAITEKQTEISRKLFKIELPHCAAILFLGIYKKEGNCRVGETSVLPCLWKLYSH